VNVILFGPPGAGKGTQANKLVKKFKLHKISTGDLLRNEMKNQTTVGIKISSYMDNGLLVPDDIIENLITKILSNKIYFNKLIFDGIPRNLNQTKNLDFLLKKNNQKVSCVLSLNIDKDSIVKRILGRQTCSKCNLTFNEFFHPSTQNNHICDEKYLIKRSDDNEEIVVNRFETYTSTTLPILNYYKEQSLLHEIDGKAEINHIFKKICTIIASLET
jgi:adenylate kinase